jgi:hypothetical protein
MNINVSSCFRDYPFSNLQSHIEKHFVFNIKLKQEAQSYFKYYESFSELIIGREDISRDIISRSPLRQFTSRKVLSHSNVD